MKARTKLRTTIAATIALVSSITAEAAMTIPYAVIDAVQLGPGQGDIVVVKLEGHGGLPGPACSDHPLWTFAFSLQSAGGRATYSTLLTAMANGRQVKVTVESFCSAAYSQIAQARWVRMAKNF